MKKTVPRIPKAQFLLCFSKESAMVFHAAREFFAGGKGFSSTQPASPQGSKKSG